MNVLHVDDDPLVRESVGLILEHRGHTVTSCASGEEAWEAWSNAYYPLVVTDWLLPGMSGPDLCKRIRESERGRDTVLVLVTVKNNPEDLQIALDAGTDDFIAKPIDTNVIGIRMGIAENKVRERENRRRTESQLREAEVRFEGLVASIPEVFFVANADRSLLTYVSPAFKEVWDADATSSGEGMEYWWDTIHPEDVGRVRDAWSRSASDRQGPLEYRILRPEGEERWIRERSYALSDGREGQWIAGVAEDITTAKRIRTELEKSEAKEREILERTARLSSLGQLAAGIAHEINNPLQGMLSHLSAVRRDLPENFEASESVDMVDRGIRTISSLIQRLLTLGRGSDSSGGSSNCAEAITFVQTLLSSQLHSANTRLQISQCDGPLDTELSTRELIQVLINLVLNALESMPEGGLITLSCDQEGDEAVIRVTDTGEGIEPENLGQIFAPFYSTKGPKGCGLGLSIVESMIRTSGGRILVESQVSKGTTMRVHLPLI